MSQTTKSTVRITKNSTKSRIYADRAIRPGRNATLRDICKGMYDAYIGNNNRLPYGHVSSSQSRLGRPVGSNEEKKQIAKKELVQVKNERACKIAAFKKSTKGKCMRKGQLVEIIEEVKERNDIKSEISPSTIRHRVERISLQSHHVGGGQISPLLRMEPTVAEIILRIGRIHQCLTPSKGLQLVNSLINGTKLQQELIAWKKRLNSNNEAGIVGRGYWRKFMKQNRDKIDIKLGQKYELNMQNWTMYSNFVHMYDHCIKEMIEAGVAKRLDEPVWMDRYRNICNKNDAFGCKVFQQLVRPDMCICGDEASGQEYKHERRWACRWSINVS